MRIALAFAILSVACAAQTRAAGPILPGHPEWPVAWTTYRTVVSLEVDFADLKAHGVGLVSMRAKNAEEAGRLLALARHTGMKYHIELPEITEDAELIRSYGLEPVDATWALGIRARCAPARVEEIPPRRFDRALAGRACDYPPV